MKIYAWTVIDGIAFFLPKEIDIGSYFFVLVEDDGVIKGQFHEPGCSDDSKVVFLLFLASRSW